MASAHSLLGLVNQLQNMELSFTTILMEAAMKLSALTDANIFVLVETQDGRKFAGKRHLCDSYMRGGLNPIGNDVEFEVDPSVCALQERQVHPSEAFTLGMFATSPKIYSRKRPFPHSLPNYHLKQSKLTPCENIASKTPEENLMVAVNIKEERDVKQDGPSSDLSSKDKTYYSNSKTNSDSHHLEDHDSDADSDIAEITDETKGSDEKTGSVSLDIVAWGSDNRCEDSPGQSSGLIKDSVLDQRLCALAPLGTPVDQMVIMDISTDKLEALQSLAPNEIFEKGTLGYRVLNSVMYELGRSIAQTCANLGLESPKDPSSKNIFSTYFDKWILDNLSHLAKSEKKLENYSRSPLGFMKQNARVHFYKVMSTILKDKTK